MLEAPLVGGGVLRSKPSPKSPLAKRKNSNFKVVIQNGSIVEDLQVSLDDLCVLWGPGVPTFP